MATLSVLGQLMGGLVPPAGPPQPYDALAVNKERMANQTALIQLEELKRSQASEATIRQFFAEHPELALGGGMQSTLGGGGAPPVPPAAAPLMQQQMMPGQSPGAAQMVPGGQDLSRYAGVSPQGGGPIPPPALGQVMPTSTPPMQSTLGQAGPPQAQDPRQAMLALARTNPDAAMAVQNRVLKIQEARLNKTLGEAEYAGRWLQSVKTPEDYARAKEDLARVLPEYAATLPPTYSQEGLQPYIDRAVSVKDRATLGLQEIQAHTEAGNLSLKERQAAAGVPKYTEDSTLNVAIDRRMQQAGIPRGTPPPEAILTQAQQDVQEGKLAVSASQGQGQLKDTPQGLARIGKGGDVEYIKGPQGEAVYGKPTEAEQRAATFADLSSKAHTGALELEKKGFQPGLWEKGADKLPFGVGNYLVSEDYQKYQQHVRDFAQAWLRKISGAAVQPSEYEMTDRIYFPQPGDTKAVIEQKQKTREVLMKNLQEEARQTGRTGTQAPPTSQGSTGTQGQPTRQAPAASGAFKPIAQMSRDERLAERDALRKKAGL